VDEVVSGDGAGGDGVALLAQGGDEDVGVVLTADGGHLHNVGEVGESGLYVGVGRGDGRGCGSGWR